MIIVRNCEPDDIPAVVDILEIKRSRNERLEPRFWKRAANSRETSIPFLTGLLDEPRNIFLVAEASYTIVGLLLAMPMRTPPVYDAGPTAIIDDFYVIDQTYWASAGELMLNRAILTLRQNGVNQIIAVSAHGDEEKMRFLASQNCSLTSAWFTRGI